MDTSEGVAQTHALLDKADGFKRGMYQDYLYQGWQFVGVCRGINEAFQRCPQIGHLCPTSLVDFMRHSPLYGQDDLQLERDRSLPREVAL